MIVGTDGTGTYEVPMQFVDISAQSPDLAQWPSGGTRDWSHSDMYSPGVALVDLDGDGHLDLIQAAQRSRGTAVARDSIV